jgi:taurine dioxygenase
MLNAPSSSEEGKAACGIAIRSIDGPLGAEVAGIDISNPLSREALELVERALHEHEVIVLRGQSVIVQGNVPF